MAVAQQGIEQAKALARQGNSRAAITLLSKLIQVDAGNAEAWLALAQVVEEPDRIEFCLQKVLKLAPGNATALEMLSKTKGGSLSVGSVSGLSSGGDKPEEEPIAPPAGAAHATQLDSIAGAVQGAPEHIEPDSGPGVPDARVPDEAMREKAPGIALRAAQPEAVVEIAERAAQPEAEPNPQDELAQGVKPRFSFGRTDQILIGLTVLAGLILCSLVGAAVARSFSLF